MTLDTKAWSLACAFLWGSVMLVVTVANLIWGNYGQYFLQTMSSGYPGYHAIRSIGEVLIGSLYGVVDGLIGGAVFAWLYNRIASALG